MDSDPSIAFGVNLVLRSEKWWGRGAWTHVRDVVQADRHDYGSVTIPHLRRSVLATVTAILILLEDAAVATIRATVQWEKPHAGAVPGLPGLIDALAARIEEQTAHQ